MCSGTIGLMRSMHKCWHSSLPTETAASMFIAGSPPTLYVDGWPYVVPGAQQIVVVLEVSVRLGLQPSPIQGLFGRAREEPPAGLRGGGHQWGRLVIH